MAITYHAGRRIQGNTTSHKVHTFTTTGNSTFQITSGSGNVEYLVGAGGAGGGSGGAGGAGGGGGGAGGARTGTLSLSTSTGSSGSHTVTVGALGAGSTTTNTIYNALGANARGSNGGNSVFDSITSTGGGGGAAGGTGTYGIGADGGSGGGDGYYQGAGSGISGQGNDGGDSSTSGSAGDWNGGGGGGAGAAGAGGTSGGGGAGGAGLQSSINGTATYYAGGGGGAVWQDSSITGGAGGSSIGGAGGNYNSGGSDATGYGSGGGGGGVTGSSSSPSYAGGDGSQGIVILRYNPAEITATGGTITEADVKDIKPTNVQAGSRWEETDTRKMYNYEAGDPTYETDFSTNTGWTTSNSSNLNIASGALQIVSTAGLASIYYDLTSITGDFLIRYTTSFTTMGSQSLGIHWCSVSDNTSTAQTSQDGLSFMIYDDANVFQSSTQNGVRPDQSPDQGALTNSPNPTTGTNYYVELKRDGSNWITSLYNNADYDSVIATKTLSINAGITGLRYFKVITYTTGADVGQIDDLKFYNGVTTPVMPNVWSELGT
jgi:hypothetical protein